MCRYTLRYPVLALYYLTLPPTYPPTHPVLQMQKSTQTYIYMHIHTSNATRAGLRRLIIELSYHIVLSQPNRRGGRGETSSRVLKNKERGKKEGLGRDLPSQSLQTGSLAQLQQEEGSRSSRGPPQKKFVLFFLASCSLASASHINPSPFPHWSGGYASATTMASHSPTHGTFRMFEGLLKGRTSMCVCVRLTPPPLTLKDVCLGFF